MDATTTHFLPGLQLSERSFHRAVAPILERHFPKLRYGAGRLGRGSKVLGFDTQRSMDHDWGPQVEILLADSERVCAPDWLAARSRAAAFKNERLLAS